MGVQQEAKRPQLLAGAKGRSQGTGGGPRPGEAAFFPALLPPLSASFCLLCLLPIHNPASMALINANIRIGGAAACFPDPLLPHHTTLCLLRFLCDTYTA